MPSYLITGANGQLGQCFYAVAKEFPKVDLYFAKKNEVDITRLETISNWYKQKAFDGIINCAAYTAVDQAEKEEGNAFKINVDGIQNLIAFAEHKNLSIIHFSTDYVFDGQSVEPYAEKETTNPIGIYGNSKLKGELRLSKSSCKNITIRISWLFSPFRKNFVKTIARLVKEKSLLEVVDDQWGRPTYGIDLARTVLKLLSNDTLHTFPILHYANQGVCNWKVFADFIVNELECKTVIQGISTSAYPTLVKRPNYSILNTERIERELGVTIPTWQESLKKCIQILKNDGSF
jgi:dTDP-4-dehydrorhamnose reductase